MEIRRKGLDSSRSFIYRLSAYVRYGVLFVFKQGIIKRSSSCCHFGN